MTTSDDTVEGQMLDETVWLEFAEFCTSLHVEQSWVVELVDSGLIEPRGVEPQAWRFPASALSRVRSTVRLVNDLGVNLAGAAVILDLLEERRQLLARLRQLEHALGE
jgi:chaperone modulatory protein CbpM